MGGSLLRVWVLPAQLEAREWLWTHHREAFLTPGLGSVWQKGWEYGKLLDSLDVSALAFGAIRESSCVRALAASFCALQRESEVSKSFKIHFKGVLRS